MIGAYSFIAEPSRLRTLAWDRHAFRHRAFSIFEANISYPGRQTLAYSENLLGAALLAAPVIWLTDNPVLAMNIVARLSSVLCQNHGTVASPPEHTCRVRNSLQCQRAGRSDARSRDRHACQPDSTSRL